MRTVPTGRPIDTPSANAELRTIVSTSSPGERDEAFPIHDCPCPGGSYPPEVAAWPCLSRCARPRSTSDS
jgi:hypothetical protein